MAKLDKNTALEKLAQLQLVFHQQLPDKLSSIENVWQALRDGDAGELTFSDLHRMTHSLAGTAATFGAIAVGAAASELELELKSLLSLDENLSAEIPPKLAHEVDSLIASLHHVAEAWQPSTVPQLTPGIEIESLDKINDLIYLLDDDVLQADRIRVYLEENGFRVRCFIQLADFEAACVEQLPAAVVMDMVLSEGDIAGAEAIENLIQRFRVCPPVIFISVRTDIEARLAAARAGAARYFSKPLDLSALTQTLNGLTTRIQARPYHILVIDDDESLLEYYSTILQDAGMNVRTLNKPLDGLVVLEEYKPDLVLMDVYMPDCSGPELAQVIRQDDSWAQMPIMFLSTESDLDQQLNAMNLGGDDFLTKPVAPGHLLAAVIARAKRARWITRLNRDLERSLRETEFSHITLGQHAIVSIADVTGRITYANRKFCEISGYSREELLGQNHRILKSKQHPASFYKEMWDTISSGKVWTGVVCNHRKDGSDYWVDSTIVPFLDDKGKPYQYVSARTDITALRASEERLQRSQAFANIGTWDWNIQTGDLYWSERIASLFGYKESIPETSYENFVAAIHPDDRQKVLDAVSACVEQGKEYNIEHRVVWDNGETHWLHERGDVIRSPNGEALHMLGVVQDITQKKNTQLDLLRNRAAIDGSVDGVAILNGDGEYVYLNPAHAHIYGFGVPDELIGKKWTSMYPQNELKRFAEEIMPKFEREGFWRGETVGVMQGGHLFPQSLSLSALADGGLVCVVRDISADKQVQQALVQAKEDAENANRAKSKFLSSMSHELRTPMNAIIGFSQLLQMTPGENLSDIQADNVDEILKASNHLLELINEVLDLAKVEAGGVNLSIEPINVSELLEDCLALTKPLVQKRAIEISFSCNGESKALDRFPTDISVMADRTRLKQVMLNLLSNAVKYNSENGRMEVCCDVVEDNRIRIGVADTGAGIPESKQSQLFKAFSRLGAEQSDIEGTGMGLVITKNIVELMAGEIGFTSHMGEGSNFWVELPAAIIATIQPEMLSADGASKQRLSETLVETLCNKRTLLYIEDNPANLRLITQMLNYRDNVRLLSAYEPVHGLELARKHQPDLILMDINLPGMSGTAALKLLRQRETTRNIPVIAVSANAMPSDIKKGFEAGFNDYITKPIDIDILLQSIDGFLGVTPDKAET